MDQTLLPVHVAGRQLAAAAYGPPDGTPILFMHGTPGSRLQLPDPQVLDTLGIRLVRYDRPGYGASTRDPGRRIVDAAADAAAVAEAMAWNEFAVLGYSGGGPHALAVAAQLGDRVRRCAAVASIAPMDAVGLDFFGGMSEGNVEEFDAALAGAEQLATLLDPVAGAVAEDVFAFMASLRADLPDEDAAALDRPEVASAFADSFVEGLRPGAGGWIDDDLAFCAPWGFDVDSITVPVSVWQGSTDVLVPPSHAAWLAQAIPGAEGQLIVGSGHFGLLDRLPQIYTWLLG